jgi:ATP-dependent Lhr-like helicase
MTCWLRSIRPSWRSGAFAKSRAWRGWCSAGYPGAPKSLRQVQASSSLFFEVFRKYDPGNLLLTQAQQRSAEPGAGAVAPVSGADRWRAWTVDFVVLRHPSPLSLPLMVERFREKLSTEQLVARLDRILRDMEQATGRDQT